MTVVGRDHERSIAEQFLADASEGFVALVLEGEAGIGKTTVWRDTIGLAERRPCSPKSGSRFKVGRTVVKCSATDKSASAQTAKFTVNVKASR